MWDSVKASVSYEVTDDACTPEAPVFIGGHLGGPLGQEVEIEVSQVGENTWRGYFYRDLLHDEDYYGRGVCHWDAVGAGATFFTTAKNKFGAGASLEFPRVGLQTRYVTPRTRYFKKNHASADVVSAVSHTLDAVDRRLHPTPPGHEALGVLPAAPSLDPATLRAMQTHLNTLGVRDTRGQPLAVSGTYDRATRRGVEDFQEVHGLPVTGLPDRATVSLLEAHVKIAELQKPSTALDPQTVAATLPRATPAEQPREVPHGLVVDRAETQASQQRPLSDPSHPQHALYSELKGLLPKAASEERLAQLTLACHQGNIKPGRIESITLENKHAVIVGLAGYANVDMSHPSPPLQQSLQKMENIHQQQSQQQILSPQQSPSQGGQSLSRSLH